MSWPLQSRTASALQGWLLETWSSLLFHSFSFHCASTVKPLDRPARTDHFRADHFGADYFILFHTHLFEKVDRNKKSSTKFCAHLCGTAHDERKFLRRWYITAKIPRIFRLVYEFRENCGIVFFKAVLFEKIGSKNHSIACFFKNFAIPARNPRCPKLSRIDHLRIDWLLETPDHLRELITSKLIAAELINLKTDHFRDEYFTANHLRELITSVWIIWELIAWELITWG